MPRDQWQCPRSKRITKIDKSCNDTSCQPTMFRQNIQFHVNILSQVRLIDCDCKKNWKPTATSSGHHHTPKSESFNLPHPLRRKHQSRQRLVNELWGNATQWSVVVCGPYIALHTRQTAFMITILLLPRTAKHT